MRLESIQKEPEVVRGFVKGMVKGLKFLYANPSEAAGIAKYSWPEFIEVFDDFPRTPSLKVVKRELVKAILERTGAAV